LCEQPSLGPRERNQFISSTTLGGSRRATPYAFLAKGCGSTAKPTQSPPAAPPKPADRCKLYSVMSRPEIKALHTSNVLLQNRPPGATNESMDKAISTYTTLDQMKSDEYRDWQELPAHERMSAVAELTLAAYRMREPALDVRRLQRTLVHLQRPES
jgi:hypothetical protein